jgi:hypothetical protein
MIQHHNDYSFCPIFIQDLTRISTKSELLQVQVNPFQKFFDYCFINFIVITIYKLINHFLFRKNFIHLMYITIIYPNINKIFT